MFWRQGADKTNKGAITFSGGILMGQKDFNRVWRWSRSGLGLLIIFLWVGISPLPVAAQQGFIAQPMQNLGKATSATMENAGTKVQAVNQAAEAQSQGKLIESPGPGASRGKVMHDQRSRKHYYFEFSADGLPKGSDPAKAYWFETRDGKLMLVDPRITQRYSRVPR